MLKDGVLDPQGEAVAVRSRKTQVRDGIEACGRAR